MSAMSTEAVWECIVGSIKQTLEEHGQEVDEVKPSQQLVGDLGIDSVNIVHLMVTLEDKLDQPLNFYKLVSREGNPDSRALTAGELHQFVCQSIDMGADGGAGGP